MTKMKAEILIRLSKYSALSKQKRQDAFLKYQTGKKDYYAGMNDILELLLDEIRINALGIDEPLQPI